MMNTAVFKNLEKSKKVKLVKLTGTHPSIFNGKPKHIPTLTITQMLHGIKLETTINKIVVSSATVAAFSQSGLIDAKYVEMLKEGLIDERLFQNQIQQLIEQVIVADNFLRLDDYLNNMQQDLMALISQSMTGFGLMEVAAVAGIIGAIAAVAALGFVIYDHYNSTPVIGGTAPGDDYDGDGTVNSQDPDDDNDGIYDDKDATPKGGGIIFQRELPDYFIDRLLNKYQLEIGFNQEMIEFKVFNKSYQNYFRLYIRA